MSLLIFIANVAEVSFSILSFFTRRHATLHLAVLVRPSIGLSISELGAVFASLLLPNHPRLDCRVSGLAYNILIHRHKISSK